MMILVLVVGAYVVWKFVLPRLKSGSFGGGSITSGSGNNNTSSSISSGNGNGNSALDMVNNLMKNMKSGVTACSNGNCQHYSGDNVSVHCENGVCHSNAAHQVAFTI